MTKSLIFRLAVLPLLAGAIAASIAFLPIRFLVLSLLLLAAFTLVDIAALHPRGIRQNLCIGIYSLLFAFAALEGIALALNPAPTSTETRSSGLYVPDPIYGLALGKPGIYHAKRIDNRTGAVIYDVDYTIEAGGIRRTDSAIDGPTVAVIGDSWAFGHGVADRDTMEQRLADLSGGKLRVLNLGVAGYGPQHYLMALQSGLYDKLFGSNLALIVISTTPWQIERVACKVDYAMQTPRYTLTKDGGVETKGSCANGVVKSLMMQLLMNSNFYRRYFEAASRVLQREDVEIYIAVLAQAVKLAQEKYHVPVLLTYDRAQEELLKPAGSSNDAILARFADHGIAVLEMDISHDVAPGTVFSFPEDHHPTAAAQHARANVLHRYLVQHMHAMNALLASAPSAAEVQ